MAADDWNVLAGRMTGDGSIEIIETELPIKLSGMTRSLSAPSRIDAAIENKVLRLQKAGRPILEPWNSVLIVEASGHIRSMTIYQKPTYNGKVWSLDQIGLGGYPIGMPYTGEAYFTQADPLDIYRHVWEHLQSQPGGDLGVTIDGTTSPVLVGTPQVEADSTSGPRSLTWWDTPDLGKVVDDYSRECPFDWRETFYWDGDNPRCHIQLGYPIIGGRKPRMRFVLGENMSTMPSVTEPDYINQAYVLGAGEGRERIRGYSGVNDGRLRRVRVVDDKGITAPQQADQVARDELIAARGKYIVDEIEVFNHSDAPLEAIELGDEVALYAETPWAEVDEYVRVVGKTESPQENDRATLQIVRASTL